MEDTIKYILVDMDEYLTANQSQKLQRVLVTRLTKQVKTINNLSNDNYLSMFLNAKKIEGCSERTLAYYKTTVEKLLDDVDDPILSANFCIKKIFQNHVRVQLEHISKKEREYMLLDDIAARDEYLKHTQQKKIHLRKLLMNIPEIQ